ncbi:hypothetical protein AAFF_G00409140 [Aldrovandia affinis]|uniref:Reverse transcriptase domain-containing protein n=1 Tax=Aldrovandia affinis TaxID=143900 RepID=A0AAD7R3I1_9TELE|nr:hypothetical protein AAFF_G00409140 [Aldrovandia affinis]
MQGDVFLLQEVHLRDGGDVSAFTREWVWGPSEWSVGGVHSDGVGILFRGFSFVIDEAVGFITGRVIFVDFTFMSVKYRIVNVYAPAQEGRRLEVFRELPGCLSTSRSLILGGDFNVSLDGGCGGARAGEGGVDYSVRALEGVVGDFSLADAFRTVHPGDAGYTWRNSRGKASRLDYIFVGGGICGMKCVLLPSWASDHDMLQVSLPTDGPKWGSGFWRLNTLLLEADAFKAAFTSLYRSVRTMKSMYVSVVEWWEAAKCRFAIFCRRFAASARRRDRAGVTKWTSSLSYLHGCLNRGEYVDWALYEGAKERLRGLLEARAKALAFQARLRELEEGEKPSAYFFQAARARRSAPAFVGLKRPDGTVAEGSAMLAVAEAYYAELFSRRACDPVVEAALLDCVSARLESEEAQSMEADVSLEEVREALLSLRDGRSPGHDGIDQEKAFDRVQHGFLHGVLKRMGFGPRFIGWVRTLYADVYSCVRVNGFLSGPVEQLGGVRQGCPLSPLLYVLFMEPFAELVRRDPGVDGVRLPGASGEVLKIQQYADDTTLFVSSARSLGRIRALTDLFGAGTGSKVNLAKSSVLYCGCWRDDRSGGGFSVCTGGLKILGVRFFAATARR